MYLSSSRQDSSRTSNRRIDLGEDAAHHREIALDDEAARLFGGENDPMDENEEGRRLFIYGTRICIMNVKRRFLNFLKEFQTRDLDDDERGLAVNNDVRVDLNAEGNYYMERLMEIEMTDNPVLNVSLKHIMKFDEDLYKMIIAYPAVSFF